MTVGSSGYHRLWMLSRQAAMRGSIAVITVAVAGCGGGGGYGGTASSAAPGTYQQFVAYSKCMRGHGDPGFPDPQKGPGGAWLYPEDPQTQQDFSGPGYDAAQRACKKLQPSGGLTPAEREAAIRQLLKLAACMRAHGITSFPDPATNHGGAGVSLGAGIDPSSSQFQAAQKACHMPGT
jgi:hypothetical protein